MEPIADATDPSTLERCGTSSIRFSWLSANDSMRKSLPTCGKLRIISSLRDLSGTVAACAISPMLALDMSPTTLLTTGTTSVTRPSTQHSMTSMLSTAASHEGTCLPFIEGLVMRTKNGRASIAITAARTTYMIRFLKYQHMVPAMVRVMSVMM